MCSFSLFSNMHVIKLAGGESKFDGIQFSDPIITCWIHVTIDHIVLFFLYIYTGANITYIIMINKLKPYTSNWIWTNMR